MSKVNKRFGLALGAGLLTVPLWPGVATAVPSERPPVGPPPGAEGPPVDGCPNGGWWREVTPSGPEHLSAAYDFNFDNRVCGWVAPSGALVLMDNVVR
jgi:hypothetical protein